MGIRRFEERKMRLTISHFALKVASFLIVFIPAELGAQTQGGAPVLKIIHFNVGNGDSTLVVLEDGSPSNKALLSVLIDGGNRSMAAKVVIPGIRAEGIQGLDSVIATHKDTDHMEGLYAVLDAIPMNAGGRVYGLDRKWALTKEGDPLKPGIPLNINSKKDVAKSSKYELEIECVAADGNVPERAWDLKTPELDENARSLAFLVTFGKFRYFIGGDLTGGGLSGWQASADIESRVAKSVGPVTVLRINHHGSVTSSNSVFLGSLDPSVAIISAGPDPRTASLFKWPSETVLARLTRSQQLKAIYVTGVVDATNLSDTDKKRLHDGKGNITISTTGEDSFKVNEDSYPLPK